MIPLQLTLTASSGHRRRGIVGNGTSRLCIKSVAFDNARKHLRDRFRQRSRQVRPNSAALKFAAGAIGAGNGQFHTPCRGVAIGELGTLRELRDSQNAPRQNSIHRATINCNGGILNGNIGPGSSSQKSTVGDFSVAGEITSTVDYKL
jgi:hypothetical protein